MAENQFENQIGKANSSTYFSLEDILTEYSSPMADYEPPKEREDLREQSKRIVMEAYEKSELASAEIGTSNVGEIVDSALSETERESTRSAPKKSKKFPKKKHGKTVGAPPAQASRPEIVREERDKTEPVRITEDDSAEPENLDLSSLGLIGMAEEVDDSDVKIASGPIAEVDDSDVKIAPNIGRAKREGYGAVRIGAEESSLTEADGDDEPAAEVPNKPAISEYEVRELLEQDERLEYASADAGKMEYEHIPSTDIDEERRKRVKDQYVSPVLALLALVTTRIEKRAKADEHEPTVEREEDEGAPDMPPKKAVKFYSSQMKSFSLRTKIALIVSGLGAYITLAFDSWLPLAGALGKSTQVASLVLLIILFSVMITGLDVLTSGIMSLVRKRPTFDTLVALSCICSVIDAIIIASGGAQQAGLPLCAVSAFSMTFALWGAKLTCAGYRSAFRVLTAKRLWSISSEKGASEGCRALVKSDKAPERFVSKSEEADRAECAFSAVAAILMACALVFSLLASFLRSQGWAFFHCLSVMTAVCAVFSGPISFALPFSLLSRSLSHIGGAVAGWSGLRDIGKSEKVVVKDEDIFPTDTIMIADVRILENASANKVISYAGSVVAASGGAASGAFANLMRKNSCTMKRIENFDAHDGCGMTAVIDGESVLVGNGGFMNLMGIRVPQKLNTQNSVYAAISGTLVGIFNVQYKPTAKVQRALLALMNSRHEPLFAIRDFNINPVGLKKKFRISTDKMEFPKLSERFRISAIAPDEPRKISAVTAREGLDAYVEIAVKGRRAYSGINILTVLSVAASCVGLVAMFFLCWAGAFDSCSADNVLTYMLLSLVPTFAISWSVQR